MGKALRRAMMAGQPSVTIEGVLPLSVASSKEQVAKYYGVTSGEAVIMQQLVSNNTIVKGRNGASITIYDDYIVADFSTANGSYPGITLRVYFYNGHKYFVHAKIKVDDTTSTQMGFVLVSVSNGVSNFIDVSNIYTDIYSIGTCLEDVVQCSFSCKNAIDGYLYLKRDVQIFDLTAMQMEDVTTPDEFAQRLGYESIDDVPYIPYTEEAVVGSGDVQEDGTYKLPITNTLGSTTNVYLSRPLMKIGDAADYVDYKKGCVVRKIGVLDMGEQNWTRKLSSRGTYYFDVSTGIDNVSGNSRVPKALCIGYSAKTGATLILEGYDMCFGYQSAKGAIMFRNDSIEDAASFKSSVSGVMFYYELANPVEEPIDLPSLPLHVGANVIDVETIIKPTNIYITCKK